MRFVFECCEATSSAVFKGIHSNARRCNRSNSPVFAVSSVCTFEQLQCRAFEGYPFLSSTCSLNFVIPKTNLSLPGLLRILSIISNSNGIPNTLIGIESAGIDMYE